MRAKFYVYELIDPRAGTVFYVGKGTGDRITQHEREARNAEAYATRKVARIRAIWAAGLAIERRHVASFWSESDAYAFEAERIREIGFHHLTNETQNTGCGRRCGVPNRVTGRLRQVVELARGMSHRAGVAFLVEVANSEPAVFCRLLSLCLPKAKT